MNIAIVGYGKMGRFYDSLLKAKYIIDVKPVKNRCFFSNIDEFIKYAQPVDLVIVASIPITHFGISYKLLSTGYNVLCEKPICLTTEESKILEKMAENKKLILYQSTLERFNPLIKFIKNNVSYKEVKKVMSYRYGNMPTYAKSNDAKFDLGIHDLDLWFYLFNKKVIWELNTGYGKAKRLLIIKYNNGKIMKLNLINKFIEFDNYTLDFDKSSKNNQILEMIYDVFYKGRTVNERWSEEIKILEKSKNNKIYLLPKRINKRVKKQFIFKKVNI